MPKGKTPSTTVAITEKRANSAADRAGRRGRRTSTAMSPSEQAICTGELTATSTVKAASTRRNRALAQTEWVRSQSATR